MSLLFSIITLVKEGELSQALTLIKQAPLEILESPFEYQSRHTSVLCEVSLLKSYQVVDALLNKGVNVNQDVSGYSGNQETAILRLILAKDFDEHSVAIGKLLKKYGATLFLEHYSSIPSSIISIVLNETFFVSLWGEREEELLRKLKFYNQIMEDEFYEHLLYLKNDRSSTPLSAIRSLAPNIFPSVVRPFLEYLDRKPELSKETLARLLISSEMNEEVIAFIRRKLGDENKPKIEQFDNFLQTEIPRSEAYSDERFKLFIYENEKAAFNLALSEISSPLSYNLIYNINETSLQKTETSGSHCSSFGVVRGGYGSVADESILGFIEYEKLAKETKWYKVKKYGNEFDAWIMYPCMSQKDFISFIDKYNADISLPLSRIDKLKRIIKLASDLSRIHYYCEGNKRTSYIVLNRELVKHGFPPSMLEKRKVLRTHSQEEIMSHVLDGMKRLKQMAQPRTFTPLRQNKHSKRKILETKKVDIENGSFINREGNRRSARLNIK